MMNEHIRQQMDVANPFKFQHITNLKSIEQFDDSGPSVSEYCSNQRDPPYS